jgi:membrane-associated phospholipid phosphatase
MLRSTTLTTSVGIQPIEQRANASSSQGNRAVSSSVVNVEAVAIGVHRVPAGKHNIIDVAVALVVGLGPKDPRISS